MAYLVQVADEVDAFIIEYEGLASIDQALLDAVIRTAPSSRSIES